MCFCPLLKTPDALKRLRQGFVDQEKLGQFETMVCRFCYLLEKECPKKAKDLNGLRQEMLAQGIDVAVFDAVAGQEVTAAV